MFTLRWRCCPGLVLLLAASAGWGAEPRLRGTLHPEERVNALAFSPDGKRLVSGHSTGQVAKLWSIAEAKEIATLLGHEGDVWAVRFSPDGRVVATASEDATIRFWDAMSGAKRGTWQGANQIHAIEFHPDGDLLASASVGQSIELWNVKDGKKLGLLRAHKAIVVSLAFSSDGRTLASGSHDGIIKLWDVGKQKETATLRMHTDEVTALQFAPDGKTLASASRDMTVRLWDVMPARHRHVLTGHTDRVLEVAFVGNSSTLATASSDDEVRLLDLDTMRTTETLEHELLTAMAVSNDGKLLATGSYDKSIKIWEVGGTE